MPVTLSVHTFTCLESEKHILFHALYIFLSNVESRTNFSSRPLMSEAYIAQLLTSYLKTATINYFRG